MNRSPEPLFIDCETIVFNDGNEEEVSEIRDAEGVTVAYVHGREDAERIVQCVNACASLKDPGAVPELLEALRHATAVLEQLQDNMTRPEALQAITRQGYTGHAVAKARAVIAKATGNA